MTTHLTTQLTLTFDCKDNAAAWTIEKQSGDSYFVKHTSGLFLDNDAKLSSTAHAFLLLHNQLKLVNTDSCITVPASNIISLNTCDTRKKNQLFHFADSSMSVDGKITEIVSGTSYSKLRELGSGSFSIVFETTDPNLVVKILNLNSRNQHDGTNVDREIAILKIMELYHASGVLYDGSALKPYVVMKKVDGIKIRESSLSTYKNPKEWITALDVARVDMHKRGILHNDLGLSNIIFNPLPTSVSAIIVDFGLANFISDTSDEKIDRKMKAADEKLKKSVSGNQFLGKLSDTLLDYVAIKMLSLPLSTSRLD